MPDFHDTAVIIPCYNEEVAIASVVTDFQNYLPGAAIYVFDNASKDQTAQVAKDAGATVMKVSYPGKGNVVRRMFADVEADIYLMADGDGTYPAEFAPELVNQVRNGADMSVGARKPVAEACYRSGHKFGNRLLTGLVKRAFRNEVKDMLSGYRAFSRRFVKSFPATSSGFEIETELTFFALEQRLDVQSVDIDYLPRGEGSTSKLSTYQDGIRILLTIVYLFKEVQPFAFFSSVAVFLAMTSLILGIPLFFEFMHTGLVLRFPTAILASGLAVIACIMFCIGILLDSVARLRRQSSRQAFLRIGKGRTFSAYSGPRKLAVGE